jgi:uncharacterized protein with FMN-binding domain
MPLPPNARILINSNSFLRKFKYWSIILELYIEIYIEKSRIGGNHMAKMNKQWVFLCSTAIAAVYTAGYFSTETQASIPQSPLNIQAQSNGGQTNSVQTNKGQTYKLYKDGTYTGMGSNRRGSIEVAVTIKNDKITDVQVTDFAMHYSDSDIVGMPEEVVQKQSAKVTNVSGATYSTQAFQNAVQDALSQAK